MEKQGVQAGAAAIYKTLLIVEDQFLLAMTLRDELEDGGYHVLELVGRHQEAMALAREGKPDLALVNIGLANGDDGVALAQDLHMLGIPVLFISGQPDKARLASTVAVASLAKPYSPSDMLKAVDYLFRHEQGDESRAAPDRLEMYDVVGEEPASHPLPPG